MKGIILSGGTGSRLYPMTQVVNKQLLPVFDKPMIYYPLSTLISKGINEICIISSIEYINLYKQLFNDGKSIGINIEYRIQPQPNGIAQSFIIAEDFIKNNSVALILGDNIFHGELNLIFKDAGANIFAYEVTNPQSYGVVEFNSYGEAVSLEEKPKIPKSNYAVPGFYVYDSDVTSIVKNLKPSDRGELEITDLNCVYMSYGKLKVTKLQRGFVWLDAGTPVTLQQASTYIQTIQERQGIKIGCIEEESYKAGFINKCQLTNLVDKMPKSDYKFYLEKLL